VIFLVDKEGDDIWDVIAKREGKVWKAGSAMSWQNVLVGCAASFTTSDREIDRFSWWSCAAIVGWWLSTCRRVKTAPRGILEDICQGIEPWGHETVPDIKVVMYEH